MYRLWGEIPSIKQDRIPKRLLIFDTEAYRNPQMNGIEFQSIRLGVSRYLEITGEGEILKSVFYNFRTGEDLASWIEWWTRKDKTLYVYGHNIKYDLQLSGVITILISQGWEISLFVVEDPPTFIRLKKGRKAIMFVDTFNYWQFSLEKMGDQLGLAKLEIPEGERSDEEWFIYCQRDVEVLSEYLLSFIRFLVSEDLCGLGLTTASQAFRSYRYRFMTNDIHIHKRQEVINLERDAYSGGRVEAFYIGSLEGDNYYKLDVNSMYPYVMKNNLYPNKFVGYSENIPLSKLRALMNEYYVIADVRLDTPEPFYPLKYKSKLVFPVGIFRSVLHHSELSYALDHNHVKEVLRIAIYEQADLFSAYVNYFYEMKLKATRDDNPVLRKQAKLFLNSLYGKFGQRGIKSKIVDNPEGEKYDRLTGYSETLGCRVEVNYLGDKLEIRYIEGESAYSFPAIAGAVTANARVYLYSLIKQAGLNHVFYTDTDSLITDQDGYYRLKNTLHNTRLGALKLEGLETFLTIYGLKDYVFGDKTRTKGVPKRADKLGEGLWEYQQFRGAKTWIKQGLPVGVEVYTRQKRRLSKYDKGVVTQSGRVLPLFLG